MTLMLELSPELEQELLTAAAAAGLSVEVLAARWLAEAAQRQRRVAVVDLLQGWLDADDAREQDADMILAAQAVTLGMPDVVIATTNVGHLSRFAAAELWRDIAVG